MVKCVVVVCVAVGMGGVWWRYVVVSGVDVFSERNAPTL